jgi:hypothetical protein
VPAAGLAPAIVIIFLLESDRSRAISWRASVVRGWPPIALAIGWGIPIQAD